MPETAIPVWLTASQAAKRLRVDRWTIWNWVKTGKLTPVAYGGREALFDPATINALAGDDPADYKGCSECGALTLDGADFCPAHAPATSAA